MKHKTLIHNVLVTVAGCTIAVISVLFCSFLLLTLSQREKASVTRPWDTVDRNQFGQETYGVDVSWAIHGTNISSKLGRQREIYHKFVEGCEEAVGDGKEFCVNEENMRLKMNREQPLSMQNYTKMGFSKIKAPKEIFSLIQNFWNNNHGQEEIEWHNINTYHNMWESPPSMIKLQNETLIGGGRDLYHTISQACQIVLEEWTGQMLLFASLWGIRVYPPGSILAPHVDRSPLVSSAIINVDQDVDEPWPLEVYGHDGKAYNITMEPGDMVLYESQSILHGRPFPLKGRYFANIFIHFETIGVKRKPKDDTELTLEDEVARSLSNKLPPYILAGSPWEQAWKETNPEGWRLPTSFPLNLAQRGDAVTLASVARTHPSALETTDSNGWAPIHEAARSRHLDVIKVLVTNGVDVNRLTGYGQSALKIAKVFWGHDDPICNYLVSVGALEVDDYHEEL